MQYGYIFNDMEKNMSRNTVVYTVTGNHTLQMSISIYGLVKHYNLSEELDILIVSDGIPESEFHFLQSIPKKLRKENIYISLWSPPSADKFLVNNKNPRFPSVVMWRIFIPFAFFWTQRIIYLDNDTLITGSISDLFSLEFPQGKFIAGVRDFYIHDILNDSLDSIPASDTENVNVENYINSGVLVIDCEQYRQTLSEDTLTLLAITALQEYELPDQTLINKYLSDYIWRIDPIYNYQVRESWEIPVNFIDHQVHIKIKQIGQVACIKHFLEKPWNKFISYAPSEIEYFNILAEFKSLPSIE